MKKDIIAGPGTPKTGPEFEDLRMRQVALYFVTPLMAGIALLVYGYHLKQERMVRQVSGKVITGLIFTGGFICYLSFLMLAFTAIAKGIVLAGTRLQKWLRVPVAAIVGISLIAVPLFVGVQLGNRYDRIEERALQEHGRNERFRIDRGEYSPGGHGGPFRYLYFTVPDQRGGRHSLRVTAHESKWVTELDNVWIRYLPVNPEIYVSLETGIWH